MSIGAPRCIFTRALQGRQRADASPHAGCSASWPWPAARPAEQMRGTRSSAIAVWPEAHRLGRRGQPDRAETALSRARRSRSRPKRLSVTEIGTWIRDPYAIYARHILGLTAAGTVCSRDRPTGAARNGVSRSAGAVRPRAASRRSDREQARRKAEGRSPARSSTDTRCRPISPPAGMPHFDECRQAVHRMGGGSATADIAANSLCEVGGNIEVGEHAASPCAEGPTGSTSMADGKARHPRLQDRASRRQAGAHLLAATAAWRAAMAELGAFGPNRPRNRSATLPMCGCVPASS